MAAILGSYLATMLVHIAIAKHVLDDTPVLMTSAYSAFICWTGLMVMVFFIKRAWVSWMLLVSISIASTAVIFLI